MSTKGDHSFYKPGTGDIVPSAVTGRSPAHKNNKQAGGKKRETPGGFGGHHKHDHPMAHPEVHHASHHAHKGMEGQKAAPRHMNHSGKISERPMGAFRYHEVFGKKK